MPGGTPEAYQHIEAIVEKVAAQVSCSWASALSHTLLCEPSTARIRPALWYVAPCGKSASDLLNVTWSAFDSATCGVPPLLPCRRAPKPLSCGPVRRATPAGA